MIVKVWLSKIYRFSFSSSLFEPFTVCWKYKRKYYQNGKTPFRIASLSVESELFFFIWVYNSFPAEAHRNKVLKKTQKK